VSDRDEEAKTPASLAVVCSELARVQDALQCSEKALAICREWGNRKGEAENLHALGAWHIQQGQMERATELYTTAAAIFRELGEQSSEALALKGIGTCYYLLGQMDKAVEATRAAVRIFDEMGGGPTADETRKRLARFQKMAAKKWWQFWL
jgi:tetratricopeptide (TPR) repeat protein